MLAHTCKASWHSDCCWWITVRLNPGWATDRNPISNNKNVYKKYVAVHTQINEFSWTSNKQKYRQSLGFIKILKIM